MQAAVQYQPALLSQFSHSALNCAPNSNPAAMPTPPIPARKRKRPHQYTVSYSEVQEIDQAGRLRDVIVIDDTAHTLAALDPLREVERGAEQPRPLQEPRGRTLESTQAAVRLL